MNTRYGYVLMYGRPIINRHPGSTIQIGPGCVLVSDPRHNPAGINHPVILATLRPGAVLVLAGHNGLSGATICAAEQVTLGPHSQLGVNSSVYDTDFHSVDPTLRRRQTGLDASVPTRPVTIGADVWVGAAALVLKGVHIGDAAVVAAGAVVTREVPTRTVVAGNPARAVKTIGVASVGGGERGTFTTPIPQSGPAIPPRA